MSGTEKMFDDYDVIVRFKPSEYEGVDVFDGDFSTAAASTDRYTLNSEMSFHLDLPYIAKLLNVDIHEVKLNREFNIVNEYQRTLHRLGRIIFFVESWQVNDGSFPLSYLKMLAPDCAIVVLGWDDYYYSHNIFSMHDCFPKYIELVDLYLSNTPEAIPFLRNKLGVNAHFFISTPCKKLIELIEEKINDFNEAPHSLGCFMSFKDDNKYRSSLKRYLHKSFDNPLLGKKNSHHFFSKNIRETLMDYAKIKVHLGNTSSAWDSDHYDSNYLEYAFPCMKKECSAPHCTRVKFPLTKYFKDHRQKVLSSRCMKGVKDFIAPLMGAPLIYDDFKWNKILYEGIFPFYDYNNFDTIKELYHKITDDSETTMKILDTQKAWIKKYSFFNQFKHIIENNQTPFHEYLNYE